MTSAAKRRAQRRRRRLDYAQIEHRVVAHMIGDLRLPQDEVKRRLDKLAEDTLLGKTHTGRLAKP